MDPSRHRCGGHKRLTDNAMVLIIYMTQLSSRISTGTAHLDMNNGIRRYVFPRRSNRHLAGMGKLRITAFEKATLQPRGSADHGPGS